jgi:H+/Cl- antiporter ClcA
MGSGAISIGLVALAFAALADLATRRFEGIVSAYPLLPLAGTPLAFAAIAWATRRFAPQASGSGIPQVIAATRDPRGAFHTLVSMKVGLIKCAFTLIALLAGGSVGREGPTVQISAAILSLHHRLFRVPLRSSMIIAGGAAGVAAAFNTPLAGVTFAIEELADANEQRVALLVMTNRPRRLGAGLQGTALSWASKILADEQDLASASDERPRKACSTIRLGAGRDL